VLTSGELGLKSRIFGAVGSGFGFWLMKPYTMASPLGPKVVNNSLWKVGEHVFPGHFVGFSLHDFIDLARAFRALWTGPASISLDMQERPLGLQKAPR